MIHSSTRIIIIAPNLPLLKIGMSTHSSPIYQAIGHAAYAIASTIDLAAIVTFTNTGDTARMIARDRPKAPVVALTPNIRTVRQLNLVKNVYPFLVRECHSLTEVRIEFADILKHSRNGLTPFTLSLSSLWISLNIRITTVNGDFRGDLIERRIC